MSTRRWPWGAVHKALGFPSIAVAASMLDVPIGRVNSWQRWGVPDRDMDSMLVSLGLLGEELFGFDFLEAT